jgi:hypothetical protein
VNQQAHVSDERCDCPACDRRMTRIATMTPEQLAEKLADYMATSITPWPDESALREAVRETVRLLFTQARPDLLEALGVGELRARLEEAQRNYERAFVAGDVAMCRRWAIRVTERRDALAILEAKGER